MTEKSNSYLTQSDVAEILHTTTRSLERMRQEGTGPKFMKFGRRILYTYEDIDEWLAARSYLSTAEAKRARI